MADLVKIGNKGWECPECGAFCENAEELNHRASCSSHPTNAALNRLNEIRSSGGNTKTLQEELSKADAKVEYAQDKTEYAQDKTEYAQDKTEYAQDKTEYAQSKISDATPARKSRPAPALVGSAEIVLSQEMMQSAMQLFLETYFSLTQVTVEKITGDNLKGFKVKFRSG